MKQILLILSLFLLGCSSKDASHLPSLFELPGAIIGTTIENARYNAKRERVQQYVTVHYDLLRQEVAQGQGKHLNEVMYLAGVSGVDQPKAVKEIKKDYSTMFHNSLLVSESIASAFGRLYMPKKKTKKMNGFSYTEVRKIIDRYLKKDFETFRLSLKNHSTAETNKLADLLHIRDPGKRKKFLQAFTQQYEPLYIDPVVVGIMIRGI